MSAPEPGQRFTANSQSACCPTCDSADLTLTSGLVAALDGVFACSRGHQGIVRDYADVTPVDPGTGHAVGYPRPAETQTPSPCPPWCRIDHPPYTDGQAAISHLGTTFVKAPTTGTNVVTIVNCWTKLRNERPPKIMVENPEDIGSVSLDADGARTMAAAIAAFNRRSPLASALRRAAVELDRINRSAP